MKNRSYVEIAGSILQAVNDDSCSSKTQIMYKAFLGFAQTRKYLQALTDSGLVVYDTTSHTYALTEYGRGYLQLYNELDDMVNLSKLSELGQYQAWIEEEVDQRIATAKDRYNNNNNSKSLIHQGRN